MPGHSSGTSRTVSCPTCGAQVEWSPQQQWRPFCSERCRLIDLGQWLDGSHSITGEAAPETAATEDDDRHP